MNRSNADDSAVGHGENLCAVTDVAVNVGRIAVDELSVLVELQPINRKTLGKVDAAVAGDTAGAVHADGRSNR